MIETFTSTNARISVPYLGQGWQFEESSDQPQGQNLITQVRCRLAVPGEFALLTAQDTLLPPEAARPAEAWAREVLSARYAQTYEEAKLGYLETIGVDGRDWLEVSWELIIHARLAPLAKIERLLFHHNHLLVLSAEASSKDLRRYWPEVAKWLEQSSFGVLEKKAES